MAGVEPVSTTRKTLEYEAEILYISAMPTTTQLKKAIQIAEQIQSLEAELAGILSGVGMGNGLVDAPEGKGSTKAPKKRRKRSKMSPEGRARIAAAQKLRWAKAKAKAGK
jgi:hypothetical protein